MISLSLPPSLFLTLSLSFSLSRQDHVSSAVRSGNGMQELVQMPRAGAMKSALAQQNLKLHAEVGVLENEVQSMSSAMQRLMSSPGGEQVLALHHHI